MQMKIDKAREAFIVLVEKYKNYPEFLGIDILEPNQPGAFDDTLLHLVSRRGVIEDILVMLKVGANVNVSGDMGNTPLHGTALANQIEAAGVLLQNGANPRIKNELGETPQDVAQSLGYLEIAKLLAP